MKADALTQAWRGGARLPRPPNFRSFGIDCAVVRLDCGSATVREANDSATAPEPTALWAAARQIGQCCFEPFGWLVPLPSSALVQSGIRPSTGSKISALRDDEGAQQKALAMMLPNMATTAKHAHGLPYARKLCIKLSYVPVTSTGIVANLERRRNRQRECLGRHSE